MGRLRLMAAGDIWLQTGGGRHPFGRSGTSSGTKTSSLETWSHALKDRRAARKHHVLSSPPDTARYLVMQALISSALQTTTRPTSAPKD